MIIDTDGNHGQSSDSMTAARRDDGRQLAADSSRPDEAEARIAATDNQIDELVYELYGLTDDEIRIVEEARRKGDQG